MLNALLSSINKDDVSCVAFLDSRLELPESISANIRVNRVESNILKRLLAELKLKRTTKDDDVVLSFGNLPPLFRLNAKTILFIQNRYLVDNIELKNFRIKIRLRIYIERIWLKWLRKNIDTVIVQTPSMQKCVLNHLGHDAVILPFVTIKNTYSRSFARIKNIGGCRYDFLYVASGEPHKHHKQLVDAWVMLSLEGIYPVLCLTLNEETNQELVKWIRDMVQKYNLKIINTGFVPQSTVFEMYKQTKALIYPSTLESFGLPLIEARNANLPIIASELDYIRDLLDPEETFDPSSPKSIARAVKRFLGYKEKPLHLVDPERFLNFCINYNSKRN